VGQLRRRCELAVAHTEEATRPLLRVPRELNAYAGRSSGGLRRQRGGRGHGLGRGGDAALNRLGSVEEHTLSQLSDTEDADIAKTLIDFNSQQAAYQAALKAGATIVQTSLMDFLR